MQSIRDTYQQFIDDLAQVQTTGDLENIKVKYLGKKGPIQQLMKDLRELSAAERPIVGKEVNDLKELMTKRCDEL